MNQAHIHLVLNHLPMVGTLIGLLALIAGYLLRNSTVKKTALGVFIFAAVFAIPVYLTGEGAEEIVEGLPGVSEGMIGRHEELASIFIWIVGALGLVSIAALLTDAKLLKISRFLSLAALVIALGSMFVAKELGTSGGAIRHTEIRTTAMQGMNGETANGEEGDED